MNNKYVDSLSILHVIGNVYKTPSILDDEKYKFLEEYFPNDFHRIVFGAIYNLHMLGNKEITTLTIDDYLSQRPKQYGIYKSNNGSEYLEKAAEYSTIETFPYYYNRVKKFTLLRMYNEKCGMDLSWLYDTDNILDATKKQKQEDWLDNTSVEEIAEIIDKKIQDVRLDYAEDFDKKGIQAGDGLDSLIDNFMTTPDFGYPMYGDYINTITRGARLKKVYMRSAATGLGKSRTMIADICSFACNEIFNTKTREWETNGTKEPSLFISTEQEKAEIQSMMLCFISGVNEDHILTGRYEEGELARVRKAAEILKNSPLYIEELPDFSMQDIENCIKRNIRDNGVKYVAFDYIHSSMKILSEISSKAGVKGLREDNILFMIGVRLKDLANQYEIFILTATQLNGNYQDAKEYDQNLLRGAKSLGDKIDCGMILLKATPTDLEALKSILIKQGVETPDMKISVYKNRRGRYRDILLWCKSDRGTCRINPLFVTDYQFELLDIPNIKIKVKEPDFNDK